MIGFRPISKEFWPFPNTSSLVWRTVSRLQMGLVATLCKVFLKTCTVKVYNLNTLYEHIEKLKGSGTSLLTVCNHKSCCDDPMIWGLLRLGHIWSLKHMRWSLAAQDMCFTTWVTATISALGQ
eukprot:Ihof_evm2s1108 gene=Ihof_evmTU2s1108